MIKSGLCVLLSLVCAGTLCAQNAFAIPLIRDAEIEHTLHRYGDPIFQSAGLKPSAVKIFIVNDDNINAFVAGGSNLFLHTGLILSTDTPDMLIGAIAHETGHIAGGHLARGAEKLKNAQIGTVLSVVLGAAAVAATRKPEAASAVIGGTQNAVMRNFLSYTRANEEAADQAALSYLDRLGISAAGFAKMFSVLQRNERMRPGAPDPYLLSHPLSAERIDHVRAHVERSTIPEGQYPKALDLPHQRMVAKLYAFLASPEHTLQKYPLSNTSVPARMARAIAYYKMADREHSLKEMQSLLANAPKDPFLYDLQGQIMFENNLITEALSAYQAANALMPNSALMLTDLAKVELAQAPPRLQSAITHLEKAVSLDKNNSDSWHLLAIAYGKSGIMGMSYLALGEEAIANGDPKEARRQAELATSALKPKTPAYQRAADVKAQASEIERAKKEMESDF